MGRKAKHHFIPRSYLKRFTEKGSEKSQFWCVPNDNSKPYKTTPKDACAKRDYYTIEHSNPLLIEDWYANEIEPLTSKALDYIETERRLMPEKDIEPLLIFIATLYLRVPSFRSMVETSLMRQKEIVESISSDVTIANKDDFNFTKNNLVQAELSLLERVVNSLSKMHFKLWITNNSEFDIVTSDRPFVLTHPNGGNGFHFGLGTPNVELCIPINRKTVLIGKNEKQIDTAYPDDPRFIALVNHKVISSSEHYFYSSKQEIALLDDNLNVYKHKIVP